MKMERRGSVRSTWWRRHSVDGWGRIQLREGDAVIRNDTILASIQPSAPDLLDARSLAQARARVQASEASVERAQTRCDQIKIELEHAETRVETQ